MNSVKNQLLPGSFLSLKNKYKIQTNQISFSVCGHLFNRPEKSGRSVAQVFQTLYINLQIS